MSKPKTRRIPHPIWFAVAAVLMVGLWVFLAVWLPDQKEQVVNWEGKNSMDKLKPEELLSRIVAVAVVRGGDYEGLQIIETELKSHGIQSVAEGSSHVFEISVLKDDAEKARDIIRKSKRMRDKWVKIRESSGKWVSLSDSCSREYDGCR